MQSILYWIGYSIARQALWPLRIGGWISPEASLAVRYIIAEAYVKATQDVIDN